MKLRKSYNYFFAAGITFLVGLFAFLTVNKVVSASATDGAENERHFVTIHDGENSLTIKTDAKTVGEALERAKIDLNENDLVDPEKDVEIDSNNYHIDLYRARPVIVKEGKVQKYLMTAEYDKIKLAGEAGFILGKNDTLKSVQNNTNILETGLVETYEVARGEKAEEAHEKLENKSTDLKKLATPTEKTETPVSVPAFVTNPDEATCKAWIRAAGVAEKDVETAYWLIDKESHCRYNATNRSSGAYGIPQALPGNKMASQGSDWKTNPITQIKWMIWYVNSRYGGWANAKSHWLAKKWY